MNDLINIENKILVIRGQQVMLDRDLAELYGVETKNLNKAMNRNKERFPEYFCFQLSSEEFSALRFHFGTSNTKGGRRYLPYAFTEQGVAMRRSLLANSQVFQRLDRIETKQLESEQKIETLFSFIHKSKLKDTHSGIAEIQQPVPYSVHKEHSIHARPFSYTR